MQTIPEKRDPDNIQPQAVDSGQGKSKSVADFEEQFSRLSRWDTTGEAIGGAATAGAIYAVTMGLCFTYSTSSLIAMAVLWPVLMILGFITGAFSALLVAAVLTPINASIGWPLSPRWSGFVIGGLAGFLPFTFSMFSNQPLPSNDSFLFITLGPFTAMTFGHLGAYLMTDFVINQHNRRPSTEKFKPSIGGRKTNRFQITHLMILTAWTAVGLAAISSLPPQPRSNITFCYLQTQPPSAALALAVILLTARLRTKNPKAAKVSR